MFSSLAAVAGLISPFQDSKALTVLTVPVTSGQQGNFPCIPGYESPVAGGNLPDASC